MIKECCDNCKKEIGIVDTDAVVINVNIRDRKTGRAWNYSEDTLCRDCAKNFTIHVEGDVEGEIPA
jgi:hypothetical protein